jgi:proline iminopeptidase
MMDTGGQHRIYWEQSGNAGGAPVLFLHGGPGSGIIPRQRQFFDPAHYRIILFDQRGSGRSEPLASIEHNTTWELIADIEQLRDMLDIKRWLIFGGSWGSTLALAYAQRHPERCTGLIVRGIWLGTDEEMLWWLHGTQTFFPDNWRRFVNFIPEAERGDLLAAYHKRLMDPSPAVHLPAAVIWKSYETACTTLHSAGTETLEASPQTLAMSRIMAHYFIHRAFLDEDALIDGAERLAQVPGYIIQGRYDMICPLKYADRLAQAWPQARFEIVPDAGHSAFENGTIARLIAATEACKGLI